jgi:hypothetical protein
LWILLLPFGLLVVPLVELLVPYLAILSKKSIRTHFYFKDRATFVARAAATINTCEIRYLILKNAASLQGMVRGVWHICPTKDDHIRKNARF